MSNVILRRTEAVNSDLQAKIAQLYWHHSIDLGDGIITPGGKSISICSHEARLIFDRVNLTGRSVLDVGAWSGFFSFEAKKRGASRVLATDSYTWSHPHFRGREGFEIARAALGMEIDAREIDVANLSEESVGQFDVVLYLGVFYHRYDAIEALARVASLAKQVLIVETHLDLRDKAVPGMVFYPGHELNNDATNWWGPNIACIVALLKNFGFAWPTPVNRYPAPPWSGCSNPSFAAKCAQASRALASAFTSPRKSPKRTTARFRSVPMKPKPGLRWSCRSSDRVGSEALSRD